MIGHTSSSAITRTPLSNSTCLSLTNADSTLQFLTTSIDSLMVDTNSNPLTNQQAFYQHLQQPSTCLQQDLYQQCSVSQSTQQINSENQHTVNTVKQHYELVTTSSPMSSNYGNDFSPISISATRTANYTNSTPLLSQGNTSVCDPPQTSSTSVMQPSDSNLALGLQQGDNENISTLSGVSGPWGTTADDQQYSIHLSVGQGNNRTAVDLNSDLVADPGQRIRAQLQFNHHHQIQRYILATGELVLKSQTLGSGASCQISPSSQETSKDHKVSASQSNPADQQTIQPTSSGQSKITAPDSYNKPMSSEVINRKRTNMGHLGTNTAIGTPPSKKAKPDGTSPQQPDRDTEITTPALNRRFTAAMLQKMSREQLMDCLVIMENERIGLLKQLEDGNILVNDSTDNGLVPATADNNMVDNNNKASTGGGDDDDDDDDDDDEEAEGVSNVAGTNRDGINNGSVEMKCLWKDCGTICIGGTGLTDHIIATHIGGGKSIYPCEWENCRRNQKPFTKRHKLCNHLRTHSGERPFVCDKAGCDKRFSRSDSLITHIKTHSTVRSFVCHIPSCGKAYYHIRSLKKHLKLHNDDENTDENGGSTLNSNSNSNANLTTAYASNITTAATEIQPTQQQQLLYTFQGQMALPQFALQPTSNTATSSMHSKPLLDPSLYNSSHSLFDPLAFQGLPPQQQFTQMNSTCQMQIPAPIPNTNTNITMMNQPNALLQQQQQQQQQQNEYNMSLFL